MPAFDQRERDFENKYKHDEQLKFRVQARRNRMLGEWAGGLLGLSGEELAGYARDVVQSDFERPGDDDVLRKVHSDLMAKGVDMSERRLRTRMDELLEEAKQQVMAE